MRRYAFHLTLHEFVELGTWMRDSGMADLSWDVAAMESTSMSNAECTQVMLQHSYKDHQDIRMRDLSESAKHRGRWLTPLGHPRSCSWSHFSTQKDILLHIL